MGIWGGLWSFPEFNLISEIDIWLQNRNILIYSKEKLDEQRHTFSHFHLDYTPLLVKTENPINNVMEENQSIWYKTSQDDELGFPAPISRLLQKLN